MFKKKFHNSIDKGRYGYLFIAPFFIVFAVFGLYPIVYTFILSFQKWDGLAKMTPLGWKNYARLLTDASTMSVGLFLVIAILSVFAFRAMQSKGAAYDD